MVSWRQPFSGRSDAAVATASNDAEFSDGSLKYVGETGGNSNAVTYQEATGAPVENESPLGYDVGPFTIVLINVTMMIGTGIYSTRMFYLRLTMEYCSQILASAILHGTGSVGLTFIYWTLGYLVRNS